MITVIPRSLYPDCSKNVVSGKDTTTGTSRDNLNKSIDSGNNTKSSGNYNNTSDQNRDDLDKAIKHGQDVANDPHAGQKDIDNATKQINDAVDNINHGQTDATKNKPVIPSTKTPVSDNSHLTDDEKGSSEGTMSKRIIQQARLLTLTIKAILRSLIQTAQRTLFQVIKLLQ